MRILWSSNAAFCKSGYGVQSNNLLPRFVDLGHEVAQHAWYGIQGGMLNINMTTPKGKEFQLPIYPGAYDTYGNDIAEAHYQHYKADCIITLIDAWVLRQFGKKNFRWIPYAPIDHDPAPQNVISALEGAYRVVSYAKFGAEKLNECGIKNTMIPHGVDVNVYKPKDRDAARKKLNLEADFVVGMVAANKGFPPRKAFPENLQALAIFKERHPNVKTKLYLHTLEHIQCGGVDFDELLLRLNYKKEEVTFVHQYQYILGLDESYMADAYNAMDVLLAASRAEGFGIPLIESQACGTPVVTTNFSSMPELCFAGWLAEPAQRDWTPFNSWQVIPSVESILEGLEQAYEHRGDAELRERARVGAQDYSWDVVVEKGWKPFLADVERQIGEEVSGRVSHAHRWARTGLYDGNGNLEMPCLAKECTSGLVVRPDGVQIIKPEAFNTSPNGVALDLDDDPNGGVTKIVCREIERTYDFDSIPFTEGDVVVDVGAQVGAVSCYLGKRYPMIKVLAYEPIKANYDRLVANIAKNGLTNVEAFQLGVTADGRDLELRGDGATNSGGYSMYGKGAGETVKTTTLFEIVRGKRIKLLKLDCEGAEYEILQRAEALMSIQAIRGEFHCYNGHDPMRLKELCEDYVNDVKVTVQS